MRTRMLMLMMMMIVYAFTQSILPRIATAISNTTVPEHLCFCLDDRVTVRLPKCYDGDHPDTTWSRFNETSMTWSAYPWVTEYSGIKQNYVVYGGVLVILEAFVVRDEGLFRCEQLNSTCVYNVTLYQKCYCATPEVRDPSADIRSLSNLHDDTRVLMCNATIGPCSLNGQCMQSMNANVTWNFRSSQKDGSPLDPGPMSSLDLNQRGRGIVKTAISGGRYSGDVETIQSTYTLTHIDDRDYGAYVCRVTNARNVSISRTTILTFGAAENTFRLSVPAFWLHLLLGVVVSTACVLLVSLLVYIHLLDIRLWWHGWFSAGERADGMFYDATIVGSTSHRDVAFVTSVLLPKTEVEHRYKLAYGPRDFDVSSDDASYLDFMRESHRLIFIVSSDFLREPSVGYRAFQNALSLKRWKDLVYIILPDIPSNMWTANNMILKKKLDKCGSRPWSRICKLDWRPEVKFMCFNISEWSKRNFWKRFFLSMPPRNGTRVEQKTFTIAV